MRKILFLISFSLLISVFLFSAPIAAIFSSNFDSHEPGIIIPGWGFCSGCDLGSSSKARFSPESRPIRVSEDDKKSVVLYLNNTDSIVASFDSDSTQGHRLSFSYKAEINKDTGSEGAYISLSYGETGGICETGFVIGSHGIYLSRFPTGEPEEWNFSVQDQGDGWNGVSIDIPSCEEVQSNAILMITVTTIPDDWGTLFVDDISVEDEESRG